MGLIRQADSETLARDARVLDFADVAAEAEAIIAGARAEAERVITEAQREREALVSSGFEDGRAEGLAKGEAEGREAGQAEGARRVMKELRAASAELDASWAAALAAFGEARSALLEDVESDIVVLAAQIAERVTKRSVDLDGGAAVAQLRDAIAVVLDRTRLTIEVHPDDVDACRNALPSLMGGLETGGHARVVPIDSIRRGSVVIRTPKGSVDASVDTQIDSIVAALLRDRERGLAESSALGADPGSREGPGELDGAQMSGESAEGTAVDARPTPADGREHKDARDPAEDHPADRPDVGGEDA